MISTLRLVVILFLKFFNQNSFPKAVPSEDSFLVVLDGFWGAFWMHFGTQERTKTAQKTMPRAHSNFEAFRSPSWSLQGAIWVPGPPPKMEPQKWFRIVFWGVFGSVSRSGFGSYLVGSRGGFWRVLRRSGDGFWKFLEGYGGGFSMFSGIDFVVISHRFADIFESFF